MEEKSLEFCSINPVSPPTEPTDSRHGSHVRHASTWGPNTGLNLRQDVALGPKIKKSMKWVAVAPFAAIFAGIVSYGPPGSPGIGPRA